MADETDHLIDAAFALDTGLADRTGKPEEIVEAGTDFIPKDATDVPQVRDRTAIRRRRAGSRNWGE